MPNFTMQQIAGRITAQLAVPKPPRSSDGFAAGDPSTIVTGIATTFVPTMDVLRRAADTGRNLIVSHESPYWNRGTQRLADDPLYRAKHEFIEAHKLAIYRLRETWQARPVDGQFQGLARSLGWDKHKSENIYFHLPPANLQSLVRDIRSKLNLHAVRTIGDPRLTVVKVALTHGMITVPELAKVLQEPAVDAVVIGEPVEWEASPYFQDVIASGRKTSLIVLGLAASEEPGSAELAAWLKSFIADVPVEFIPAGEPFAAGRWS
jgi:putative NIF3 family GTP cyclohydrolase 1 type 2